MVLKIHKYNDIKKIYFLGAALGGLFFLAFFCFEVFEDYQAWRQLGDSVGGANNIHGYLRNLNPETNTVARYFYPILAAIFLWSLASIRHHWREVSYSHFCSTLAGLFSLASVLGSYRYFFRSGSFLNIADIVTFLLVLIGGYTCFYIIIMGISELRTRYTFKDLEAPCRSVANRVFWRTFFLIATIDFLYLFFVDYPGSMCWDSVYQFYQGASGVYVASHPVAHTLMISACRAIAQLIGYGYVEAIFIYSCVSIVMMALVIAFVVQTLYEAGLQRRWVWGITCIYAFHPLFIEYSVFMVKNVPASLAVCWLTTLVYRRVKGIKTKYLQLGVFLSAFSSCILLKNGLAGVLVLCVGAIYYRAWLRDLLFLCLAAVVAFFGINAILTHALPVHKNIPLESNLGRWEALSIPLQQMARVSMLADSIADTQRRDLDAIGFSKDVLSQNYMPWLSDPLKRMVAFHTDVFLDERGKYIKSYLYLGMVYPQLYGEAWIEQTKGFWNADYKRRPEYSGCGIFNAYNRMLKPRPEAAVFQFVDLDIAPQTGVIKDIYRTWHNLFYNKALGVLSGIGFYVWIFIGLFVRLRKERLAVVFLPVFGIWGSLLMSTPLFYEHRYIYSLYLTLPLLVFMTLIFLEEKASSETELEKMREGSFNTKL